MLRLYIHCLSCILCGPFTDLTQLQNVARLTVKLFFNLRNEYFFSSHAVRFRLLALNCNERRNAIEELLVHKTHSGSSYYDLYKFCCYKYGIFVMVCSILTSLLPLFVA